MLPDYYTLKHWQNRMTDQRLHAALWRSIWMGFAVLILDIAHRRPRRLLAAGSQPAHPHPYRDFGGHPVRPALCRYRFRHPESYERHLPKLLGTPWIIWLGHAAIAFPVPLLGS